MFILEDILLLLPEDYKEKPIFALEIPYPLPWEWRRIITKDPSEKTSEGLPGPQLVLDYVALSEGAIRDHAFFFTDDTAKRHDMNQALAKRAGWVENLSGTTEGKARKALFWRKYLLI